MPLERPGATDPRTPPLFGYLARREASAPTRRRSCSPPAHYGVVFGILGIGNNLAAAAGPWLSGVIYDRTASYLVIDLWAAGVGLIGLATLAAVVTMTRRRPKRRVTVAVTPPYKGRRLRRPYIK
jgi:MFS family permease